MKVVSNLRDGQAVGLTNRLMSIYNETQDMKGEI